MSREEFDKHFSPPYNPWQQRFCLAPKGDFYKALGTDKADIVTGHIDTFTENGIKMKDGTFVEVNIRHENYRKYFGIFHLFRLTLSSEPLG